MSYDVVSDELALELNILLAQQRLTPFFQPIVATSEQRIMGYEALIRGPENSQLHLPFYLFHTAHNCGQHIALEYLCCQLAIEHFMQQQLEGQLFINLSLSALLTPTFQTARFIELLGQYGLSPERVVLELSEAYFHEQFAPIQAILNEYRSLGIRFALDDMGSGYAGLRLWTELKPRFIKIDHYFCSQLEPDSTKLEMVRAIRHIAVRLNCQLIAEGVETEQDYQLLLETGVSLAQGHYFASPQHRPPTHLPTALFTASNSHDSPPADNQRSNTVASLIRQTPAVRPNSTVEQVSEIFHANPNLYSIAVLDEQQVPIGIIRRHDFMHLFLSRYGRELYGRKFISAFMDSQPIVIDWQLPLEEASQRLTSTMSLLPEHDFIITDQGRYLGLGNIMDLLRHITELQIRNARYANPLTELPGNVPIYEYIEKLLQEQATFAVCYCDLDNFKPFNDVYGYDQGDAVIRTVANILTAQMNTDRDFVGHVGGDDFILVMRSEDWIARCEAALAEFAVTALQFYNETDQHNGGIHSFDRKGNATFYSVLSLSIGAVIPDPIACQSHHDVAALASEAKHQAKKLAGNQLFLDRRRRPAHLSRQ